MRGLKLHFKLAEMVKMHKFCSPFSRSGATHCVKAHWIEPLLEQTSEQWLGPRPLANAARAEATLIASRGAGLSDVSNFENVLKDTIG